MKEKKSFNELLRENWVLIIPLAGFLIVLFSLLRINKWETFTVVAMCGTGITLLVIGIDLAKNKKVAAVGYAGIICTVISILYYYFEVTWINDIIAVLFSVGITLILIDTFTQVKESSHQIIRAFDYEPVPVSGDIKLDYKNAIGNKLTDTMSTVNGLISTVSMKMEEKEGEMRQQMMKFIEIYDKITALQSEIDHPTLRNLHSTILDHLSENFITAMGTTAGDPFNPKMHKAVNPMPKLGCKGTIKKVEKIGFIFKNQEKNQVVREATVYVDWVMD